MCAAGTEADAASVGMVCPTEHPWVQIGESLPPARSGIEHDPPQRASICGPD